jgi:recombination protein RecT
MARQGATKDAVGDALATGAEQGITSAKPKDELAAVIDQYRPQISAALPATWSAERFVRILTTQVRMNPKLLDADRRTLIAAMMQAAQLGLTPGIHCYLIPRKNGKTGIIEVQYQNGYKGVAELVRRSGYIAKLTTGVVRPGDVFTVELGSEQKVTHVPLLDAGAADRPMSHVYSIVWYKDSGEWDVEVMDRSQVDTVMRRTTGSGKCKQVDGRWVAEYGPWATDYDEMARKTVLLRHAKRLPMSDEDRRALEVDDSVKRTLSADMLGVPDTSEVVDVMPDEELVEVADEPQSMMAVCGECSSTSILTPDVTASDLGDIVCSNCGHVGLSVTE